MRFKKAVALRYERQLDAAPRVVAKGAGAVAEAIVNSAKAADVRVMEQTPLVDALMHLEVDDVIPQELFEAIAIIFASLVKNQNAP